MQKKVLVTAIGMCLAVVVLALVTFPRSMAHPVNATYAVTLGPDKTNLTLLVSNKSTKSIMINIQSVDVRAGTNWAVCPIWKPGSAPSSPMDSLVSVSPQAIVQKQITVATPLLPGAWRIRLTESEEATGVARYLTELKWHFHNRAAFSSNSFAKQGTWFWRHREVVISNSVDLNQ